MHFSACFQLSFSHIPMTECLRPIIAAQIKSKSLFQQIGRETGFAPTEHGLHALTVALFRQLWRYSQESESYALSALVSSVPVGGPALTRLSSGSNGKLRGAFSKKQAIVFDSMEHALRAAFAARADVRHPPAHRCSGMIPLEANASCNFRMLNAGSPSAGAALSGDAYATRRRRCRAGQSAVSLLLAVCRGFR